MRGRAILFCVTGFIGVCALVPAAGAGTGKEEPAVCRPVVAGTWYPAEPEALRAAVERLVSEAPPIETSGRLTACIVPHSAYGLSGPVAARVFALIRPGQFDRVIVLGPSHAATFEGCSIPAVGYYRTPLGDVPLDGEVIQQLEFSRFIQLRSVHYGEQTYAAPEINRVPLHEKEYSIEAVLPFLQVRLGAFKLVPILVGRLTDDLGGVDDHKVASVARTLRPFLDGRTLLVVSSEFTHYGDRYNYRPFTEDVERRIADLDSQAFALILGRKPQEFKTYLATTGNPICGRFAICLLLELLPPRTEGLLLGYDTSTSRLQAEGDSVSYATLAFFNLAAPAAKPLAGPAQAPEAPGGQ